MSNPWLIFALSAAAVIVAGSRLSREGDRIAEITGLGGVWIGAILVAAATSLPELTTDIYAVRFGDPDLAIGDLFGSSMANMLILGVLDLMHRQTRILHKVAASQAVLCSLAMMVTTLAVLSMAARPGEAAFGISWGSVAIAVTYVAGIRLLYQRPESAEFVQAAETAGAAQVERHSLKTAVAWFAVSALAILVAARYLALSASAIADQLGIGSGFVGVLLVGLTTSLPEATVTVASVRAGSLDLAVGNLFGSNAFNMLAIPVLDAVHGQGAILAAVAPSLMIGALVAIFMMGLALVSVLHRVESRFWRLEPDAVLLILTYAAGMWLLYTRGAH